MVELHRSSTVRAAPEVTNYSYVSHRNRKRNCLIPCKRHNNDISGWKCEWGGGRSWPPSPCSCPRHKPEPIRRDVLRHVDARRALAGPRSFIRRRRRRQMLTNQLRHAQQQLRHIAAEWPTDPFRPNLQLKTFLSALADHPALTANAVAATNALQKNQVSRRVSSLI